MLVVERHVAGDDGRLQRLTGLGHALNGLDEHVRRLALLRVAEVEAVGDGQRATAGAGDVARSLGDGLTPTTARIEPGAATAAVERSGDRALRAGQADHASIGSRADNRAATDDLVVLLEDGGLRGDVRQCEQLLEELRRITHRGQRGNVDGLRIETRRALRIERVTRAVIDECGDGDVTDHGVAHRADQMVALDNLADHRALELPAGTQRLHLGEATRLDAGEHALLRLRDHDLERLHVGLAQRHLGEIELDADRAARCHLRRRRGEAGGAEVLQADEDVVTHELERGLDQALLHVGIADLDGRALVIAARVDVLRGEHRGAADAVAAGARTEQDDEVADTGGRRALEVGGLEDADAHGVDEARLLVAWVEPHLTADVGDADAVAVVADAAHRAIEQAARALGGGIAEAERIEHGNRASAHCEDVAEDAANARCGALEGLDGRRVIVALDLERHAESIADVDDARVLARTLQHGGPIGRETTQHGARMLVTAVLAPEQREHRQLEVIRLAPHQDDDLRVLVIRQPELAMQRGVGDVVHALTNTSGGTCRH